MFIKPLPIGTNPPVAEDRQAIWQVTSGDNWTLSTMAVLNNGQPASPNNSQLVFKLAEDRFSTEPFWTGRWSLGIEEVDRVDHPGLVRISIPKSVGDTLRRGVYSFSLTVADRFNKFIRTAMSGNLLLEYEPTSPQHDIPYRDPTWGLPQNT